MEQQKQIFVRDTMEAAEKMLELKDEMNRIIARWNLNDFYNGITNGELEENQEFAHLTKSEISNCITAFTAILTALGDDVSGQTTNLIKMKG